MTRDIFANTRPGRITRFGEHDFELPILSPRVQFHGATFTADYGKVRALMPSDRLHPVRTFGGRALVTLGCFDFASTSIGTYGVMPINVATVYGKRPPPLLPALGFEGHWPGFGHLCLYAPNSAKRVVAVARGEWGYPAFAADLSFEATPTRMQCDVSEGGKRVCSLTVEKNGLVLPVASIMRTYGVRDGTLIDGTWLRTGYLRTCFSKSAAQLTLGSEHPVARALQALDLDPRPVLSTYALDYQSVQLGGEVVERNVRPLEGYRGVVGEGSLRDEPLASARQ